MYDVEVRRTGNPPRIATGDALPAYGVTASGLGKCFGDLWALRDLDLAVPVGSVLGLLGHNGAGKTTALRILTTLSKPTTGSATVAGYDVGAHPGEVRSRIGVTAQQATVDGLLTSRANLEMVARLHHVPAAEARRRADDLLHQVDLTDAAEKLAKTLSGGMRRRLDLAASIISRPSVLFLDEPTTGLDPLSRNNLWEMLRGLVRDGTTLILTTQYLEEADRLADEVVVLDHGRTVAVGSPADLKARIGGDRIEVTLSSAEHLEGAAAALLEFASGDAPPAIDRDALHVTAPINEDARLIDIVRALDSANIDALDINRRLATLDDVFLSLTTKNGEQP
ncbi:MAG TPA: ATP-binding cassette domain-containing protein [Ilumatobacteraceae bacterium]